jgi:hypothetical protein
VLVNQLAFPNGGSTVDIDFLQSNPGVEYRWTEWFDDQPMNRSRPADRRKMRDEREAERRKREQLRVQKRLQSRVDLSSVK